MKTDDGYKLYEEKIEFDIEIFKSKRWKERYMGSMDENDDEDMEQVLMVRMRRVSGNMLSWMKIKRDFLLLYCSSIFKGLPRWARNLDENNVEANYEYQSNEECMDSKNYREFLVNKL